MSTRITAFVAIGFAVGLAGCSTAPGTSPPSSAYISSGAMYSYPAASSTPMLEYGYHSGPYDNTGNGPGETGLEGGGG